LCPDLTGLVGEKLTPLVEKAYWRDSLHVLYNCCIRDVNVKNDVILPHQGGKACEKKAFSAITLTRFPYVANDKAVAAFCKLIYSMQDLEDLGRFVAKDRKKITWRVDNIDLEIDNINVNFLKLYYTDYDRKTLPDKVKVHAVFLGEEALT